jgi:hypothetical protein
MVSFISTASRALQSPSSTAAAPNCSTAVAAAKAGCRGANTVSAKVQCVPTSDALNQRWQYAKIVLNLAYSGLCPFTFS